MRYPGCDHPGHQGCDGKHGKWESWWQGRQQSRRRQMKRRRQRKRRQQGQGKGKGPQSMRKMWKLRPSQISLLVLHGQPYLLDLPKTEACGPHVHEHNDGEGPNLRMLRGIGTPSKKLPDVVHGLRHLRQDGAPRPQVPPNMLSWFSKIRPGPTRRKQLPR